MPLLWGAGRGQQANGHGHADGRKTKDRLDEDAFVVSSPAWRAVTRAVNQLGAKTEDGESAHLALAEAALEDSGALVLCQALKARESTALTHLDLCRNGLTLHAALALRDVLGAPSCAHVHTLELADNPLACAGVSELASLLAPAGAVTNLDVSRCSVADVGAAALAAALANGDGVVTLKLDGNGAITPSGFVPLVAAAASVSSLQTLHAAGCCEGAHDAGSALGGALDAGMPNLRSLRYSGGDLTAVLRGAARHPRLNALDLAEGDRLSPAELHEAANLLRTSRSDLRSFRANVGDDDDLGPLVQAVRLRPALAEVEVGPSASHAQVSAVARALAVNRYVREVAEAGGGAIPIFHAAQPAPAAPAPAPERRASGTRQDSASAPKAVPLLVAAPAPGKTTAPSRGTPTATASRARARARTGGGPPAADRAPARTRPSAAPSAAPALAAPSQQPSYLSAHPVQARLNAEKETRRKSAGGAPQMARASPAPRAGFSSSVPGRMAPVLPQQKSPPSRGAKRSHGNPLYDFFAVDAVNDNDNDNDEPSDGHAGLNDPQAFARRVLTQVEARLSRRARESEARVSAQIEQASASAAASTSKALASLEQRFAMLSERVGAADGKAAEAGLAAAAANDAVATSVKATKAKGAALVDRLGRLEHDAASAEEVALLREELAETRVAVRRLESQVAVLAEVVEKEEAQNRRFLEALLTAPPPGMSDQP